MGHRRQAVRVRSAGPGRIRRLAQRLRPAARPFVMVVLPAAVLAAFCVLGLEWSRSYVAGSPRFRVAAPRLALPDPPPAWWEKEFEEQINESCAFADGMSILDKSLLKEIAAGYMSCPWVKGVQWVEKRFPRQVSARIDLRLPAAAVAYSTGRGRTYHLAGEDGVRLPKTYSNWPRPGLNVPFITGVPVAPPPHGEPWREKSVVDAIKVVRLLQASDVIRRAVNITAVDVANYGGRADRTKSEFLVLAENNCVIEWGRAPDTDRPGELPVEEKIAKFERFLAEGNPTSNRTLDLRFAGRVVVSRRHGTNGDES